MKTFHEINKQYFAYLMSVARVQVCFGKRKGVLFLESNEFSIISVFQYEGLCWSLMKPVIKTN